MYVLQLALDISSTLLSEGIVTSELMFEQYSVPSLTYCVDSVMSFYQNNKPPSSSPFGADGLVVSFNTASTSVIPILNGKGVLSHAKRFVYLEFTGMRVDHTRQNTMGHTTIHGVSFEAHSTKILQLPNACNFCASKRTSSHYLHDP
jgi:hypothetical protein